MHHFKLILISDEHFSLEEIPFIKWAFANGLDRFHLRKRAANQEEINSLLQAFLPEELCKISVHYQHDLPFERLQKTGLHYSLDFLRESLTQAEIMQLPKIGQSQSFSIHQWKELEQLPENCDYAFISPLYPSISKPTYQNPSLLTEVKNSLESLSIALIGLGGIRPEHLQELKQKGFNGAAILGAVWQASDPKVALAAFFQSRNTLK
jgi:thiamine-phosphate pyrophosphorylase